MDPHTQKKFGLIGQSWGDRCTLVEVFNLLVYVTVFQKYQKVIFI